MPSGTPSSSHAAVLANTVGGGRFRAGRRRTEGSAHREGVDGMSVPTRRKLPINPNEVRTLMEDLGIDEDVARGMIAVRLGFTDNVVALPLHGFERSPAD